MGAGTKRVCLGVVTGAHGVRGLVRVKPFTAEPAAVAAYGAVVGDGGSRELTLVVVGQAGKGDVLVRVSGITNRTAAEALKGTRLFVPRDRLPAPVDGDEFYQADLIGLAAVDRDGSAFGTVRAVHNFGAGDVLEVTGTDGTSVMLPFTKDVVPTVEIAAGRVVVVPPPGLLDPPAPLHSRPSDAPKAHRRKRADG